MIPVKEFRWKLVDMDEGATGGDGDLRGAAKALADELGISITLASILVRRGVTTREQVNVFFRPTMEDLHDPYLMDGMKVAVERIITAVRSGEQITVYGDYDVDGTNGTSLLYTFLQSMGAHVRFYIPERLREGYGVSKAGIERAHEAGTRLLLTVDCGITAHQEVEFARTLGVDVIICDHHEPGEKIPLAFAVLDPLKPGCGYPFKYLSGCGVAFKLVQALFTHEYVQTRLGGEPLEALASYLDFVALATTADIVPLTGENRALVKLGLELINTRPRPGIRALIESSGLALGKINSGNIVFVIAPRINAVGRLGDAGRAVELLTCSSPEEATTLARVFEEENRSRRKLDEDTFAQAQELADKLSDTEQDSAIVLHQDTWHPGVIGIVASRLVERYYRPTIMMTTVDGVAKGSARSVVGFDIYQALRRCEDKLLQFGGHRYAAGLSVDLDRVGEFKEAFVQVARELLTDEMRIPVITVESEIDVADITPRFIRILSEFAPYGPENPRPVFAMRNVQLNSPPRVVGNRHLKLKVRKSGRVLDAIAFNMGEMAERIPRNGATLDLAFSLDESEFAGEVVPQLKIRDLKIVSPSAPAVGQ